MNHPAAPTTHTATMLSVLCSHGLLSGVSSSPVMMRVSGSRLLSLRRTECRRCEPGRPRDSLRRRRLVRGRRGSSSGSPSETAVVSVSCVAVDERRRRRVLRDRRRALRAL